MLNLVLQNRNAVLFLKYFSLNLILLAVGMVDRAPFSMLVLTQNTAVQGTQKWAY